MIDYGMDLCCYCRTLEVLSINYMNKWQLVKHLGLKNLEF